MTYLSVDTALDEGDSPDYHLYPQEYLNTLTLSGMPVHSITLKVGCPIILLRNLDPSVGLCNGTRLIVTALRTRVIEAKILSGTHAGNPAFIPRLALVTSSSSPLPFKLRRRQFPIRLAFGMSINKSQGQSLRIVGIYLLTSVFAHGQLYVALSRAIDCMNVYVSLSALSLFLRTINIVYKEVLTRSRGMG
jgi:ATP-dependent DNA helicase PIF1